jgi:hypothetical protein
MYCVIKCVKIKRVLKGNFASSVFHNCNAKTQMTQICVTGPQCVNTKFKMNYFTQTIILFFYKKHISHREVPIQLTVVFYHTSFTPEESLR